MSILFSSENGWIISHLDYLHNIYKLVEDEHMYKALKFNELFFEINSKYLHLNQIENLKRGNEISSKKNKRKLQTLSEDISHQNYFIEEISKKIINNAKNKMLFQNTMSDGNQKSRLESKKFYEHRLESMYDYHGSNQRDTAIISKFDNELYVFPKNSTFYCYDVQKINEKLNMTNQFDFILLDPPWWNKSIRRKKIKFEQSSYKMMCNEEIAKIPIKNLLNIKGIVAIWCTNSVSHVKSILKEMFPAWNIVFKAKWYWLKITQNGEPVCDFNKIHGKQPYEQLIIGTTSSNVSLEIPDKKIIISVPSAVHSHKPPLVEIFKPYLPNQPKCMEIFARYLLPGWTSWGLEILKFQHLSLYSVMENKDESKKTSSNSMNKMKKIYVWNRSPRKTDTEG